MDLIREYLLYDQNMELSDEAVIRDDPNYLSNIEKHDIDFDEVSHIF